MNLTLANDLASKLTTIIKIHQKKPSPTIPQKRTTMPLELYQNGRNGANGRLVPKLVDKEECGKGCEHVKMGRIVEEGLEWN